jgi:multidrug efflux system membrane fusion protein
MKRFSSKFIATFLFAATSVWIASGFIPGLASAKKPSDNAKSNDSIVPSVRIKSSVAEEIEEEIILYGVTESIRKVVVKSETNGRVVAIKATEGAAIQAGDPIVILDIKDRNARLDKAKAFLTQRELEYRVAKALRTAGHQSQTKLSVASANLKLEEGDLVDKAGIEIATIIDQLNFLAVGQVPEMMVGSLEIGAPAYIKTVTGIQTKGVIKYVSKIADPVTRTFRVEIEAVNNDYNLQEGITTQINIPTQAVQAHLVKTSAFALDESGEIGVKVLDAGNIVKFYPIQIVKETSTGVWISGPPFGANIITAGQAFLQDGDVAKVAD